jgi:hypothetical protein
LCSNHRQHTFASTAFAYTDLLLAAFETRPAAPAFSRATGRRLIQAVRRLLWDDFAALIRVPAFTPKQ